MKTPQKQPSLKTSKCSGVASLSDVVMFLRGEKILEPMKPINGWPREVSGDHDLDFAEVKGQAHVKRAIEVAAAGGHNLLMM